MDRALTDLVRDLSPQAAPLRAVVALVVMLSGCTTTTAPARSEPATARVDETTARERLDRVAGQLDELRRDLESLEIRVESVLSAVNFRLSVEPDCIDRLFDDISGIDLERARLRTEQAELMARLQTQRTALRDGRLSLDAVLALENRVDLARTATVHAHGRLAKLFMRATNRHESACDRETIAL